MQVTTARKVLRTDHFKTRERSSTRGLLVRYTNTINDPRIDAAFLDRIDVCKGYFGGVHHYVIRTDGRIEIGRNPKTTSSAGPKALQLDHIMIGIVGGLELDGSMRANETPEQEQALEELMQALADTLQVLLEVTDHRKGTAAFAQREREIEAEMADQDEDSPVQ